MKPRRQKRSDSAVSEILGYIMIVGLIITSIAMVSFGATGVIADIQDREHMKNVEQTFSMVQGNINDVVEEGVPARGAELRLYEATVHTEDETYINVTLNGSDPGATRPLKPITYEADGGTITYENGAVFRGDSEGSAMLHEPRWVFDDDFIALRTIQTNGNDLVSGDATVLIRSDRDGRETQQTEGENINITIDSVHSDAWKRYFEEQEVSYESEPELIEDGGIDGLDRMNVEIDVNTGQTVIYTRDVIELEIS